MPALSSAKIVLYNYWRSSSSYRVRFALAVKGLEYTTVPVNLLADEQSSAKHKAINPMGYVPCLLVDGTPFIEFDDPRPLAGNGHDRFGFSGWAADLFFDNLVVQPL